MIAAQQFRMFLERNQARRRQHSGLPHPAPKTLAIEPALCDRLASAGEHRSYRRPQRFRQTEHDGINRFYDLSHGNPERFSGVEHARAIHVDFDPQFVRTVRDLANHFQGIHGAASHVVRVLDFDQTRGRPVRAERANLAAYLVPLQNAVGRRDGPR